MKAMILAAGLGNRMRPLTDKVPKPLLQVAGQSLIEHQIRRLKEGGIREIVINHFYHGDQIEQQLGDGSQLGVFIQYSRETIRLETAGGIIKALPILREESFVVANADVWTDFPFGSLQRIDGEDCLAHLILVPNSEHHPNGDFFIDDHGRVHEETGSQDRRLTFSGISVLHRNLFAGHPVEPLPLVPLLSKAMARGKVRGELYQGVWMDIGTPERLQQLNDIVKKGD